MARVYPSVCRFCALGHFSASWFNNSGHRSLTLGTICIANTKEGLPSEQKQYAESDADLFYCFHPLDGESLPVTAKKKTLQVLKLKDSKINFV